MRNRKPKKPGIDWLSVIANFCIMASIMVSCVGLTEFLRWAL